MYRFQIFQCFSFWNLEFFRSISFRLVTVSQWHSFVHFVSKILKPPCTDISKILLKHTRSFLLKYGSRNIRGHPVTWKMGGGVA